MGKKIAILAGVADYKRDEDKLAFCKIDVDLMKQALSRKAFNCESKVDHDLRPLINVLKNVAADAASPEDTILFYFSGHGVEVLGEQFLLGRDGSLASLDHALNYGDVIRLSEVLDALSPSQALKLVVVDACRTATEIRKDEIEKFGHNILEQRRAAFQHTANCVVAFASADGQKSRGDDGRGSLFTVELARQLANYNCDFLHAVQKSITHLRSKNAAQIPWVYASTYSSIVPDRLRIHKSPVTTHQRHVAKRFIGFSVGEIHGLAENRLVKFIGQKWSVVGTIKNCGNIVAASFAEANLRLAAVRGTTAYSMVPPMVSTGGPNGHHLELRKVGASNLSQAFGVSMSPEGDRFAVYGEPNAGALGIACWSIDDSSKSKRLQLEGLPDGQCNAAFWINSTEGFASFSRTESERSSIYSFKMEDERKILGSIISIIESRVTALQFVSPNVVWAGNTTGALVKIVLDESDTLTLSREHPLSSNRLRSFKKGWKGIGDDYMETSKAVSKLVLHPSIQVLAVTYYDQSVAFVDLESETYMDAIPAADYPRYQPVARTHKNSFFALQGFEGTEFEFVSP
ncbi:hypothetical protein GCM10027093_16220 [Paraburkholderia jirisanensis]